MTNVATERADPVPESVDALFTAAQALGLQVRRHEQADSHESGESLPARVELGGFPMGRMQGGVGHDQPWDDTTLMSLNIGRYIDSIRQSNQNRRHWANWKIPGYRWTFVVHKQ